MTSLHRLVAALAAFGLLFALAACGEDGSTKDAGAVETAANGDVFNEADVAFATDMIPHHAQALVMVDMTQGRDLSPELRRLTEDIRAAQAPEIEQMVGWLTEWRKPIPETARDHANSHEHGSDDHGMADSGAMPGMMSAEEMADLESAQGPAFEERWLEMMIEHHEGAIEMAQDQQDEGVFGPAKDLAEAIEDSQRREIEHMEQMLGS